MYHLAQFVRMKLTLIFCIHHVVPLVQTAFYAIKWLVAMVSVTAYIAPTVVFFGQTMSAGS